jgi:hypothetical protein
MPSAVSRWTLAARACATSRSPRLTDSRSSRAKSTSRAPASTSAGMRVERTSRIRCERIRMDRARIFAPRLATPSGRPDPGSAGAARPAAGRSPLTRTRTDRPEPELARGPSASQVTGPSGRDSPMPSPLGESQAVRRLFRTARSNIAPRLAVSPAGPPYTVLFPQVRGSRPRAHGDVAARGSPEPCRLTDSDRLASSSAASPGSLAGN